MRTKRFWCAGAVALASCASVPADAGFDDVRALVADRAPATIHWNQGGAADEEASARVSALLQEELTADSAVQIALLNNRALQATYASLGVAQADLVAAGLLRNPIFEAEARLPEGGGQANLELSVVEEFLSIFFLPLRRRIAAAAFEATKLRVAGAVLDLAGEVRAAFYTVQGAQQLLEMRETVLAATEASVDLARRLHEAGNFRDLDLANERALYEQAKLDTVAAALHVAEARERLNVLLGVWGSGTEWNVAGRLPPVPDDTSDARELEGLAIERSIELQALREDIDSFAERVGLARSTALVNETEVGVAAEREDGEWTVGPSASVPLPLFSQGQPARARARAELQGLQDRYYAEAVAIRSEVRAVAARLAVLKSREAYYRSVILPLKQEIVDETQKQYNAMQLGAFQLLQAKQQEIDAGSQYIETLRNYWIARSALGQLLAGRRANFGQPAAEGVLAPGQAAVEHAGEDE